MRLSLHALVKNSFVFVFLGILAHSRLEIGPGGEAELKDQDPHVPEMNGKFCSREVFSCDMSSLIIHPSEV